MHIDDSKKQSVTVKGGEGGATLVFKNKKYIIKKGGSIHFSEKGIEQFDNIDIPEPVDLKGRKVKGNGLSLRTDPKLNLPILTVRGSAEVDGQKFENVVQKQPIELIFQDDGTVKLRPKSITSSVKVNGKLLRLAERKTEKNDESFRVESWVTFSKDGTIQEFEKIELADFFKFKNQQVRGKGLSYSIAENKLHFQDIFFEKNIQFVSASTSSFFTIDNGRIILTMDGGTIEQKIDGRVAKQFFTGKYEFFQNNVLRTKVLSPGAFIDRDRGLLVGSLGKEFDYYSGGTDTESTSLCSNAQSSCLHLTKQGVLNADIRKDVAIRLLQDDSQGNFFPFTLLKIKRNSQEDQGSLTIKASDFRVKIRPEGIKANIDVTVPGFHGIIEELTNGQKNYFDSQGTHIDAVKKGSFEKNIYKELSARYEQYGTARGFIGSDEEILRVLNSINDLDVREAAVTLCQNSFYHGCTESSSAIALTELLSTQKLNSERSFDFTRKLLFAHNKISEESALKIIDIFHSIPQTSRQDFESVLLTLDPKDPELDPTVFNRLKSLGVFDSPESVEATYQALRILGFNFKDSVKGPTYLAKTYQLGGSTTDIFLDLLYTWSDPNYQDSTLKYSREELQSMQNFQDRFSSFAENPLTPRKTDEGMVGYDIYMSALQSGNKKVLETLDEITGGEQFDTFLFKKGAKAVFDSGRLVEYEKKPQLNDPKKIKIIVDHILSVRKTLESDPKKQELLDSFLVSESKKLFGYINAYHKENAKRKEIIRSLPPELYFFMLAGADDNVGIGIVTETTPENNVEAIRLDSSELYRTSYGLILEAYTASTRNKILQDALQYKGSKEFDHFKYSLVKTGELIGQFKRSNRATKEAYASSFIDDLKQNKGDHVNAAEAISQVIKQKNVRGISHTATKLKSDLSDLYVREGSSTNIELKLTTQFIVAKDAQYFTKNELTKFDSAYDGKTFPSFDPEVVSLVKSDSRIPLEKMIVTTKDGRNELRGLTFFTSTHEKFERWHYQSQLNSLAQEGYKKQEYDLPLVNGLKHYRFTKKLGTIKFAMPDGSTKVFKDVEAVINIMPRSITEPIGDGASIEQRIAYNRLNEAVPVMSARGHTGSYQDLLKANSLTVANFPIFIHSGGCYDGHHMKDLSNFLTDELKIADTSSIDLRRAGTLGTGYGEINKHFITQTFAAAARGITSAAKQESFILSQTARKTKFKFGSALQRYRMPSDYTLSKLNNIIERRKNIQLAQKT